MRKKSTLGLCNIIRILCITTCAVFIIGTNDAMAETCSNVATPNSKDITCASATGYAGSSIMVTTMLNVNPANKYAGCDTSNTSNGQCVFLRPSGVSETATIGFYNCFYCKPGYGIKEDPEIQNLLDNYTCTIRTRSANCLLCKAGTYSGGGNTSCKTCTGQQYTDTDGATTYKTCDGVVNADHTKCEKVTSCPANQYLDGTTCKNCPSDYPKSAAGTTTIGKCYTTKNVTCTQKDGNTPNGCESATWADCSCTGTYTAYQDGTTNGTTTGECTKTTINSVKASPGYIVSNKSCTACTGETVSPGGDTTQCTDCAATGQKANSDHSGCGGCQTGQWDPSSSGNCINCPQSGTYKTCSGATLTCSANYYKNGTGTSTTCTQCPKSDTIKESDGNAAQYVSTEGSTSKDACHLKKDTAYTNAKGTFKYSNECNAQ